jgi:broad specificity phosphatase PhoE
MYYIFQFGTIFIALCIWIFTSRDTENVKAKNAIRKYILVLEGIYFMIMSKDTKGIGPKSNPDPELLTKYTSTTKTILFLRHGESDWNDIFNKGLNPMMLVRIVKGLYRELMLCVTSDSVFIDSFLNEDGFKQAAELSRFIEKRTSVAENPDATKYLSVLRADDGCPTSIIVSSNLRRCIATTTAALYNRIARTKEKIHILSSLQEISRNIDTKALAPAKALPDLHRIAEHVGKPGEFIAENVFDATENLGNKTFYFNGIKRLKAFNEWAFKRDEEIIIVGGHSLWFKSFFQTYLPHKSEHKAKNMKIVNSGIVGFTLHRCVDEHGTVIGYRVEESSIVNVYGGYTKK